MLANGESWPNKEYALNGVFPGLDFDVFLTFVYDFIRVSLLDVCCSTLDIASDLSSVLPWRLEPDFFPLAMGFLSF